MNLCKKNLSSRFHIVFQYFVIIRIEWNEVEQIEKIVDTHGKLTALLLASSRKMAQQHHDKTRIKARHCYYLWFALTSSSQFLISHQVLVIYWTNGYENMFLILSLSVFCFNRKLMASSISMIFLPWSWPAIHSDFSKWFHNLMEKSLMAKAPRRDWNWNFKHNHRPHLCDLATHRRHEIEWNSTPFSELMLGLLALKGLLAQYLCSINALKILHLGWHKILSLVHASRWMHACDTRWQEERVHTATAWESARIWDVIAPFYRHFLWLRLYTIAGLCWHFSLCIYDMMQSFMCSSAQHE